MKQLLQMIWTSRSSGQKVICQLASEKPADLLELKELAEAGRIKTVIDRCFGLEQAAEAQLC